MAVRIASALASMILSQLFSASPSIILSFVINQIPSINFLLPSLIPPKQCPALPLLCSSQRANIAYPLLLRLQHRFHMANPNQTPTMIRIKANKSLKKWSTSASGISSVLGALDRFLLYDDAGLMVWCMMFDSAFSLLLLLSREGIVRQLRSAMLCSTSLVDVSFWLVVVGPRKTSVWCVLRSHSGS